MNPPTRRTWTAAQLRQEHCDRTLAGAESVVAEHIVGMSDLDAVQIYFTTYLDWVGRSYEEFFRRIGKPMHRLLEAGYAQPVVQVEVDYVRPVGLGDHVVQQTWLSHIGYSSFCFTDAFYHDNALLAVARTTRAWIATIPHQSAAPIPDWLRTAHGPVPLPTCTESTKE